MSEKQQQPEQKKSLSDSFVQEFVKNVNDLNTYYIAYSDSLNTIAHQYGDDEDNLAQLEQEKKDHILQLNTTCRHLIRSTYIKYDGLFKLIKSRGEIEDNDKIKNPEEHLFDNFLLDVKDLQEYVLDLNSFLTTQILKDLLSKASDYT